MSTTADLTKDPSISSQGTFHKYPRCFLGVFFGVGGGGQYLKPPMGLTAGTKNIPLECVFKWLNRDEKKGKRLACTKVGDSTLKCHQGPECSR